MSKLPPLERIILEQTNIKARSNKFLKSYAYKSIGASTADTEKTIRVLVSKNWLIEENGMYISNSDSDFYLYPKEIEDLMDSGKSIHRIIKTENLSFYPGLTFEEFMKHLNYSVTRNYVRQVLLAAYQYGYIDGLPLELSPKNTFGQNVKKWYRLWKQT